MSRLIRMEKESPDISFLGILNKITRLSGYIGKFFLGISCNNRAGSIAISGLIVEFLSGYCSG